MAAKVTAGGVSKSFQIWWVKNGYSKLRDCSLSFVAELAWNAATKAAEEKFTSTNKQSTPLQTCLVCGKTDTNYIAEGVCRHCRR